MDPRLGVKKKMLLDLKKYAGEGVAEGLKSEYGPKDELPTEVSEGPCLECGDETGTCEHMAALKGEGEGMEGEQDIDPEELKRMLAEMGA